MPCRPQSQNVVCFLWVKGKRNLAFDWTDFHFTLNAEMFDVFSWVKGADGGGGGEKRIVGWKWGLKQNRTKSELGKREVGGSKKELDQKERSEECNVKKWSADGGKKKKKKKKKKKGRNRHWKTKEERKAKNKGVSMEEVRPPAPPKKEEEKRKKNKIAMNKKEELREREREREKEREREREDGWSVGSEGEESFKSTVSIYENANFMKINIWFYSSSIHNSQAGGEMATNVRDWGWESLQIGSTTPSSSRVGLSRRGLGEGHI